TLVRRAAGAEAAGHGLRPPARPLPRGGVAAAGRGAVAEGSRRAPGHQREDGREAAGQGRAADRRAFPRKRTGAADGARARGGDRRWTRTWLAAPGLSAKPRPGWPGATPAAGAPATKPRSRLGSPAPPPIGSPGSGWKRPGAKPAG